MLNVDCLVIVLGHCEIRFRRFTHRWKACFKQRSFVILDFLYLRWNSRFMAKREIGILFFRIVLFPRRECTMRKNYFDKNSLLKKSWFVPYAACFTVCMYVFSAYRTEIALLEKERRIVFEILVSSFHSATILIPEKIQPESRQKEMKF